MYLKKGFGASHPRNVTEKVPRFNKGERAVAKLTGRDEAQQVADDGKAIWVSTFDLKDFFTNACRTQFMVDVRRNLAEIRAGNPRARF